MRPSYRPRFGQHSGADMVGQRAGREDVHGHAQQLPQFAADRADIEQRRLGGRIDQQIQIALVRVIAMQRRGAIR